MSKPAAAPGRSFSFYREQFVRRPVNEVFTFFADPQNLARITPGFLHFRIVTPPPIHMGSGTLIDYQLRPLGFPLRWQSRIEVFEQGRRFSDVQVTGPYARWHHLHEFREAPGGTLIVDDVSYELPLGSLGLVAQRILVRRSLDRVFEYRRKRISALLEHR